MNSKSKSPPYENRVGWATLAGQNPRPVAQNATRTGHPHRIAIVTALEREVRPLVGGWRAVEATGDGRRITFFENGNVAVVCGGIGAEAARRATEAVIARYAPERIYSAGFAGALTPELKVGDVLRPARVVNAGDGTSVTLEGGEGLLVTFGAVAGAEQKKKLRGAYSAQAVDMEAAAVAQAAEARGVKFAAIKVISDEIDFAFPSMERFVSATGEFSEWKFAMFLAVRPWLWPRVAKLRRNSAQASRALCERLSAIASEE
jgi:adenosylhomocysteine nucleosidase